MTALPSSIPRFAPGVRLHQDTVRRRWVLLAPERLLELDDVAVAVLQQVDGERSLDAIARQLAEIFQADSGQVLTDISGFLTQLAEKRMLEWQENAL